MSDIFLSYASEDRQRITSLVESFERQDWSVWWDRNIDAGRHFDAVIEEQIQAARCVVVAWTQHRCRRRVAAGYLRAIGGLWASERK